MSIVTEIRNETDRLRAEQREKDFAEKKNPFLEELRKIIAGMKGDKNKLKALADKMDKSPLILKVNPEVLKAIDDDHYKFHLNHNIAYNQTVIGDNAVARGLDLLELLNDILSITLNPEEEFCEEPMLKRVHAAMYWLLLYIREAQAFDSLEPEEASLVCLAMHENTPFADFYKNLSEARQEERLEEKED